MRPPEFYNYDTGALGLAIFGLTAFGRGYHPFPIGDEARKTIGKIKTYRVRTGNGHYGSTLGHKYQDVMNYYTPTNRQHPAQQAWRAIHADAIAGAKALTEEQKAPYRKKADEEGGQTWLNIFVREYLLERA